MKPAAFEYRAPASVDAALELLAANPEAKLLAGGQSLVPVLNFRLANPPLLIDLNRIPALTGISVDADGALVAGAMTRHRVFERDSVVRRANPLAADAARHIAHVPIRNRGTIGGSLCHADPAAEWPAVALACDAVMTIASRAGSRAVPARDFFQGMFTTAVGVGEILTSIRFPAWPANRCHGFLEVARRQGDFALVGVAVVIDRDPGARITAARIAVFGAHDVPMLVEPAAAALVGGNARDAARIARAAVPTRTDHHARAAYRAELVEVLTRRAIEQAIGRVVAKAA